MWSQAYKRVRYVEAIKLIFSNIIVEGVECPVERTFGEIPARSSMRFDFDEDEKITYCGYAENTSEENKNIKSLRALYIIGDKHGVFNTSPKRDQNRYTGVNIGSGWCVGVKGRTEDKCVRAFGLAFLKPVRRIIYKNVECSVPDPTIVPDEIYYEELKNEGPEEERRTVTHAKSRTTTHTFTDTSLKGRSFEVKGSFEIPQIGISLGGGYNIKKEHSIGTGITETDTHNYTVNREEKVSAHSQKVYQDR